MVDGCTFMYVRVNSTLLPTLSLFFRQIKSFIRFHLAFVFGLQTYYLIDFSKIHWLKGLEPKNKGQTKSCEQFDLPKNESKVDTSSKQSKLPNTHLKSMNWISSICDCSNTAIGIDKTVFSFDNIPFSGFNMGFLISSTGITDTIIIMEIWVIVGISNNQWGSLSPNALSTGNY